MFQYYDRPVEKPQAIIFDWDNTLVDTWPIIRDALNTALISFGMQPWTMEDTKKKVRKSMRDSFPSLFGKDWEHAGEIFYDRYHEIHIDKLSVIDGAADLINILISKKIYLSVVSNKRGDLLRAEAMHLGWDKHFKALVGANDAPKDKPSREPVDLALKRSELEAGPEVWFIGDSDIDIECAKNSQCTSVLLNYQYNTKGDNSNVAADFTFPDCIALSKFIDKM